MEAARHGRVYRADVRIDGEDESSLPLQFEISTVYWELFLELGALSSETKQLMVRWLYLEVFTGESSVAYVAPKQSGEIHPQCMQVIMTKHVSLVTFHFSTMK